MAAYCIRNASRYKMLTHRMRFSMSDAVLLVLRCEGDREVHGIRFTPPGPLAAHQKGIPYERYRGSARRDCISQSVRFHERVETAHSRTSDTCAARSCLRHAGNPTWGR